MSTLLHPCCMQCAEDTIPRCDLRCLSIPLPPPSTASRAQPTTANARNCRASRVHRCLACVAEYVLRRDSLAQCSSNSLSALREGRTHITRFHDVYLEPPRHGPGRRGCPKLPPIRQRRAPFQNTVRLPLDARRAIAPAVSRRRLNPCCGVSGVVNYACSAAVVAATICVSTDRPILKQEESS